MSLSRKIGKIIDVILEDGNVEKGDEFEKYVVDLFDENYFSVEQWTTDIARKHDRFVESDCNPDLVMRYTYKGRDERFCVECKFRSDLYQDKLNWTNPEQLERYREYERESGLPFFVVIGLGGEPDYPERMFCIPLEEANYPALYPSVFERFERDPEKPFFWSNGYLS
ncbi:MAG: hypothetical protein ACC612_03550 [Methanomethylovorans sp.]|uniref:hypothetical protein n=1 Tax=Methanomethylovorans sp. TaxID=2758717 RepID=UPI003530F448